jgi:hypothetical protein
MFCCKISITEITIYATREISFILKKIVIFEPEEVYSGSVSKTINGLSTRKRKFGYIIPFHSKKI